MKATKTSEYFAQYALIILGSVLFAAGFQFFLYPNSIIVGGVSGIAMIINYLTDLPVGVMTIVLNIPLFIIAWKHFGTKFIIASLVGMLLSSVLVDLFALIKYSPTNDMLLACIIGGAVKGLGLGIIYYAGATTGGTDIIAKFVRLKFPYINFGTLVLLTDAVIIVAFAIIFNKVEGAMYAIITMFVVSKVVDLVLYGIDNSNVCYIISEKSDQLVSDITDRLHRGVTILEGEGAYSRLKFEAGGHRVQRVPVTESGGRIHTSAATVAVLPEIEDVDFKLDMNDLKIDTYRSSGAGGQHVNKTESAIRITHLPTGTVVECQDERSQYKNKDRAMQILRSKLYEAEQAKQAAAVAAERKSQIGSGDRSERVRTYNFPQNRVTDHRLTGDNKNFNIAAIMNGNLDPLIDALVTADQAEKLRAQSEA